MTAAIHSSMSRCAAQVVDSIQEFVEHCTVLANAGIEANMHGDNTTARALHRAADTERSTIIDALIMHLPDDLYRAMLDDHLLLAFAMLTPALDILEGLVNEVAA
jgi:hypothetical protein